MNIITENINSKQQKEPTVNLRSNPLTNDFANPQTDTPPYILSLKKVFYRYDGANVDVLININAHFQSGKVFAIVGKSGSGKSTLLSLIAGLDVSTSGDVFYGNTGLGKMDRDVYRAKDIGVVFQSFNLISTMTAVENIVLSMNISGSDVANKKQFALELLEKVGIDSTTANRRVLKLSGGEQQRVGIARALSHDPKIIIADEPTGNLDGETEREVLDIFYGLAKNEGKCVIIVTHSTDVASIADEVLEMKGGVLNHI